MNLQTAIVEDSKPDAERLKQLLKKAFENENISCSCFASGDEFLRAGWHEGYQVVFFFLYRRRKRRELPTKGKATAFVDHRMSQP